MIYTQWIDALRDASCEALYGDERLGMKKLKKLTKPDIVFEQTSGLVSDARRFLACADRDDMRELDILISEARNK